MRAYIGANILIWHLRGERKALNFLRRKRDNREYELCIVAMQRAEVVFFMRPEEEEGTLLFLSQFKTAPVNQTCIDLAASIYHKWYPSHGIDVNGAILAALVMQS